MGIKEVAKGVFLSIASKMGFQLERKPNNDAGYSNLGLNPTAIGANVISTIAIDDSEMKITGNNQRADEMRKMRDYYQDNILNLAAEVALGTGDCLIRPYTDGMRFGINVIENSNFVVVDSIGDFIKGCIIKLDEKILNSGDVLRLFEVQALKAGATLSGAMVDYVHIRRFVYKNDREVNKTGTPWEKMSSEDTIISNQLLFGRIKCPTINREAPNSVDGVPITFGCDNIITEIKNKYVQYNKEFDDKRTRIFADRTMFKNVDDGRGKLRRVLPNDENVFTLVQGDNDNTVSNLLKEYSPDIRDQSLQNGANFNFSILELCCGFSRGVFTSPETSFATATEMKNSLKKTFSFIKRFRRNIESGNHQLFYALDVLMSLNNAVPIGDWSLEHEWSYDYIEESRERFNQLIQMHSIGSIDPATVTAWGMDLSYEDAKAFVASINETSESGEDDRMNETA